MSTETTLQKIADELNQAADMEPGYNRFDHAVDLDQDVDGPGLDYGRQDSEDMVCAYSIFFDGGWALVLSAGEWCVNEPEQARPVYLGTHCPVFDDLDGDGWGVRMRERGMSTRGCRVPLRGDAAPDGRIPVATFNVRRGESYTVFARP